MLKRMLLAVVAASCLAAAAWANEAPPVGEKATTALGAANSATHGGAAPGADSHAKGNLLQFDVNTAVWVLVIFLVLLIVLYPTAWKNVLAGLKKREERIRGDIAQAEAARLKAEETLKQYHKQLADADARVRQVIADGVAQAEKAATEIEMRAQQEVEEGKDRATREIDAARRAALSDIYSQAAELSTSIASKILRRSINPADQQDLVRGSLEQLQEVGSN